MGFQMKTIFLAIKPRHASNIYDLIKTIEFRKVIPKCMHPENGGEVVLAILYESAPVSKVTGSCILEIHSFSPNGVFDSETLKKGCITEDEALAYFCGKPGYALSVNCVVKFPSPFPLVKTKVPQNFVYWNT